MTSQQADDSHHFSLSEGHTHTIFSVNELIHCEIHGHCYNSHVTIYVLGEIINI